MLHLGSGAVLECACGTGGTAHLGTRHGVGCAQTSISGRGEHLGEQGAAPRRVTSRSDGFVMVLYDILTALAVYGTRGVRDAARDAVGPGTPWRLGVPPLFYSTSPFLCSAVACG